MGDLVIRLFGSADCEKCKALIEKLKSNNISYSYIDAFADENQELCDNEAVYDLPHVQIIKNNNKIFEAIGEQVAKCDIVSILGENN